MTSLAPILIWNTLPEITTRNAAGPQQELHRLPQKGPRGKPRRGQEADRLCGRDEQSRQEQCCQIA